MKKIKHSKLKKSRALITGGVVEYIAACPKEAQPQLKTIRATISEVAPDAVETVSYFDIPGYSYEGYEYNGMFVWFSFRAPFVCLHVRPQAILDHKKELAKYTKTKSIVKFPVSEKIPKVLVKKLVKASLKDMRRSGKRVE